MNIYFGSMSAPPHNQSHLYDRRPNLFNINRPYRPTSPRLSSSAKPSSSSSHASLANNSSSLAVNNSVATAMSILTCVGTNQHFNDPNVSSLDVVLRRTSNDIPWGFRLQGGSDYQLQLTICKIRPGGPSEGVVFPGDAILSINNQSTRSLSHEDATSKIKNSGKELQLSIARPKGGELSQLRPKGQLKFNAQATSTATSR